VSYAIGMLLPMVDALVPTSPLLKFFKQASICSLFKGGMEICDDLGQYFQAP